MKIIYVIFSLFLLCFLILTHEFGHFSVAKLCGVKVTEFSVGMGPLLWKKQKGETQYSLRAFPIGGFCSLQGEDPDENEENEDLTAEEKEAIQKDPRSFMNQPPLKKIAILAAGPLVNILFCILGMAVIYIAYGNPILLSIKGAFRMSLIFAQIVVESLQMLVTGQVARQDLMGVVGMVNYMGDTAVEYGISNIAFLLCLISVNLGIMNLLPFPALDGGRILFVIIRAIARGRISDKAESYVHFGGMVILLILMALLMVNDTINIFGPKG